MAEAKDLPLSERRHGEKGPVAEAPRLQLAKVVVEGAGGAVFADEAALDEGGAGRGGLAHVGHAASLQ